MAPMHPPRRRSLAQRTGTLSVAEAARGASLPRGAVRSLIRQGLLPFEQVAGEIRLPARAVKRLRRLAARPGHGLRAQRGGDAAE